jgi:hypothetical protein
MTTQDGTFPDLCAESAKDGSQNHKGDRQDPIQNRMCISHSKRLSSPGQRQCQFAAKTIRKNLWPHVWLAFRLIVIPTRGNVAPLVPQGGFTGRRTRRQSRHKDNFDARRTYGPTTMTAKKTPHREGDKSPKSSRGEQPFEH